MKHSIRKTLTRNFVALILLTVSLLDLALIFGFREYTYNGVKYYLNQQLNSSVYTYERYFKSSSLDELLADDYGMLFYQFGGQVQMIDKDAQLVYDSIGAINDPVKDYPDVLQALKGKDGFRIGPVPFSDTKVLSVSRPLYSQDDEVIGVLRYSSSLVPAIHSVWTLSRYLLVLTAFVIAIAVVASRMLSKSITRPIEEIQSTAIQLADGQYKKHITMKRDDELGQLAQSINTLAAEIVRKEQVKNDFISSISHELRTPLTSIKGWAAILKDTDPADTDVMNEGFEIIERETDRLSKMVEELLDFSRYISGRITLKKDRFDITSTCEDVFKQMKPRAMKESIHLINEINEEVVLLTADEDRLRQVLINLIDNAIKFTDADGWVLFEARKNFPNYEMIISDNGVGMDENELALAKEKFYKGKHSNSHSGLGLSIADEIVKFHSGSIQIVSEKSVGTTIRVIIPLGSEAAA
ncbi:ATP-binding protein [Aedoeadaptatus pacaensis]|uniref:ATP-binding protein n=1 Tax=Aedoeadaptatus pacaensis TaxID=1776390 RepID=UPI0008397ACA|nr:ATP-binding protein [Peptoniphilus pacaensis]